MYKFAHNDTAPLVISIATGVPTLRVRAEK